MTRRSLLAVGAGGLAGLTLGGLTVPATAAAAVRDPDLMQADCAHAWLRAVYDVVWPEGLTPTNAARVYNYVAIAMYESVAPATPTLWSLAGQLTALRSLPKPPPGRVDVPCILSGAVRTVTDHVLADASAGNRQHLADTFTTQVAARRADGVPAGVVNTSVAHGVRLGRALVAWISSDGYAGIVGRPYSPPLGESLWRPTPPNFGTAIEPYWSEVRPMVLRGAAEVAPAPHVQFSTEPGSPFWEQARHTYETGLALTDEQRLTAMFWRDNPLTSGLPSGHWMQVVRQVGEQHGLSLTRAVEAYARTGVALHDAFLNCWTWKYRYNLVRPVSYVQSHIDPDWKTWVNTPQFPEYTSGHSVASAAAATVLTDLLGDLPYTDTHAVSEWGSRDYTSFREAAEQAAISRLYGGIHYPMAIDNGLDQGDAIGSLVIDRLRTRR